MDWVPPPFMRLALKTMVPLNVAAASGWNTTWKDALPWGPSVMGSAGPMTINSGRLLETCRIETACPPLLVTATVAAELEVFTVTDPKLSEAGLTPTPAWIGVAKNTELTKSSPIDRHTSRVLCMRGNPSCSVQVREQNEAEGMSVRESRFLFPDGGYNWWQVQIRDRCSLVLLMDRIKQN